MSKEVVQLKPNAVVEFTAEQIELIKSTVAKGATNDELKLFLYRCKNMGLDPLKPGQVHFVKYGNNPGSIVVGIDGFRAKADATGLRKGISRGVIRDEKGKCVGAWCEVYRKDWDKPAREEVSMAEYNTGKAMWAKMPETMIKKVAEAAALRMAFPDQLAGLHTEEEVEQAHEPRETARIQEIEARLAATAAPDHVSEADVAFPPEEISEVNSFLTPREYVIKVGKNKGKTIGMLTEKDCENFLNFYKEKLAAGERMHPDVVEYYEKLTKYLEQVP